MKNIRKTIYLDHAAATPLDSKVKKVMGPYLGTAFGNPSSLHHKGLEAKKALEDSRSMIASLLNSRPEEIIFTSGGTESCNLALLGLERLDTNRRADKHGPMPHIITTSIEHHAVLEPIKELEKKGWKVTYLPVDGEGFVEIDDINKAIRKETVLVSVMYANNEIGTIEPIAQIGRMLSQLNTVRHQKKLSPILFHTDACQAAGVLDLNVNKLLVDLMSVSASKFYGPKGNGFLYVRKGTLLDPIIHGGGQEKGLRSGTENVAGIVGMARALELTQKDRQWENKRLSGLRNYLINRLLKNIKGSVLNGPAVENRNNHLASLRAEKLETRLHNNINITIPGVEGEALMLYLDAQGICVSTGSACSTGSVDASHVLLAIGRADKLSKESIRLTLGKQTTKANLDFVLLAINKAVELIK